MKRSEVKIEYTWELGDIFPSVLAWEKQFALTSKDITTLSKYKGRLNNASVLLDALNRREIIGENVGKLYVYAKMNVDLDGANSTYLGFMRRAVSLMAKYRAVTSYFSPEICSLPEEYIEELIYNKDFADYDYYLKCILKDKEHVLTTKEEMIIAKYSELSGSYRDIFDKIDNVDMPHPKVSDGQDKVELTYGSFSRLLQSSDRDVRRKAFSTYYKLYESRLNTIASCYVWSVKCDNIKANLRKYDSALEASLVADDVPSIVYDELLKCVNNSLPLLHDYVDYRKEKLGELHMYDMYVPLFENAEITDNYEDAYSIVVDALAPLGSEYGELLMKAKNERWIDVEETDAKRGGAYSWGTYEVHPYVLLNYAGTTHDIFTIAHELGHSMHSFYSNDAQPLAKADYSIFVAEVASTVNEVLLCKYLIAKETNPEKKKYLLSYFLDMIRSTFFRQSMFAEFEKQVHDLSDKGEALTVSTLNKVYLKLNKKYHGNSIIYDRQIKCEWARIPHFYNAFYVYKYATGIVSAITLANSILTEGQKGLDNYYKFLSAGGSKSPYDILVDAGVDLATSTPYEVAMNEFDSVLEELKQMR